MGLFHREHKEESDAAGGVIQRDEVVKEQRVTFIACFLGLVASIGGFMFGYVR